MPQPKFCIRARHGYAPPSFLSTFRSRREARRVAFDYAHKCYRLVYSINAFFRPVELTIVQYAEHDVEGEDVETMCFQHHPLGYPPKATDQRGGQ